MNGRFEAMQRLPACILVGVILWSVTCATAAGRQDATPEPPKNSMRKLRVQPGPLSSQIGNGIAWEASLGEAIARAAREKKLVLWYVHTVPGTFMDRRTEIDRYMLAGPFSWESTRHFINHHFVAVKASPKSAEHTAAGLVPYQFVEPGIVILDSRGTILRRIDRLTTLHPQWLLLALDAFRADNYRAPPRPEPLQIAWDQFAAGKLDLELPEADAEWSPTSQLELELLRGMSVFQSGEQQRAAEIWKAVADRYPDHPLAWKAAAEAEGFGPFVRGFEVHRELTPQVVEFARASASNSGAPDLFSEAEIWQRSVDYLLSMQRSDGGWFDSDYDFGGTDSLPNVHLAVTAICGMALLEAQKRLPDRASRLQSAIDRAAQFAIDDRNLNRVDQDELFWAYAYRVEFLARLAELRPEYRERLQQCARDLEQFQSPGGGWFHEYRNPFVTGTALYVLAEARQAGSKIDESLVRRGLETLRGERFANGGFPYSSGRSRRAASREGTAADLEAGSGRMPICELGLWHWQAADDASLSAAIENSFRSHGLLQSALKYDNHTDRYAYGGFFFWYGMYGRSLAIRHVADDAQRNNWAQQQTKLILSLPELDGCFVDSHELGRCYGTAMALLSLACCQ